MICYGGQRRIKLKQLSFKELQEAFANKEEVLFHPDFDYERWKDGAKGSLILTDIAKMDKWLYVGYKCSGCPRCNNPILPNHHQLIKENGNHIHDKVILTEMKKKTEIKVVPNPVFIRKQDGNQEGESPDNQ